VHLDQAFDHRTLPLAHVRHANAAIVLSDAEFMAAKKIRRHLGAVNYVLTRKTGDVGTGAADVFALDDSGLQPLAGQCPGKKLAAFPTTQN